MPLFLTPRKKSGVPGDLPAPLRLDSGEAVIGRSADAQMVLTSPMVSRRHCTVSGDDTGWQLVDTSSGGTLINGQGVLGRQPLRDGDIVTIADIELEVRIGEAPAQTTASSQRMNLNSWQRKASSSPDAAEQRVGARTAPPSSWHPDEITEPPLAAHTAPPTSWDTAGRTEPRLSALAAGGLQPAAQLLHAAGLVRERVAPGDEQVLASAGAVLRASIAGLVALARARRKARTELGVERDPAAAPLEADETADDILAQLLAMPPATAGETIAAACSDLEAHERATLAAMQAAFAAVLDQFAPGAIRQRTNSDAAAWKAYEAAFSASEGFVELFADALVEAYRKG